MSQCYPTHPPHTEEKRRRVTGNWHGALSFASGLFLVQFSQHSYRHVRLLEVEPEALLEGPMDSRWYLLMWEKHCESSGRVGLNPDLAASPMPSHATEQQRQCEGIEELPWKMSCWQATRVPLSL